MFKLNKKMQDLFLLLGVIFSIKSYTMEKLNNFYHPYIYIHASDMFMASGCFE